MPLFGDKDKEPIASMPPVLQVAQAKIAIAGTPDDRADDVVAVRVGPDHTADSHDRLLDELGVAGVEHGLRHGPIGAGEVAAVDLVDDLLVRGVVMEIVGRKQPAHHAPLARLHEEVRRAGMRVAVGVPTAVDPPPARIVSINFYLEHLETGDIGFHIAFLRSVPAIKRTVTSAF